METHYVVVEFWGGPLDGFHNGWTTDERIHLPETLTAKFPKRDENGVYFCRVRGPHHYVYQWRGALQ